MIGHERNRDNHKIKVIQAKPIIKTSTCLLF